jgi:MoaA/NifB/PqqE/SkfB family radical SAM enzyme
MQAIRDVVRLFDHRPWAAHLYVTDQCNLDCHYCNEYDNSVPHPSLEDLTAWMTKIRELGVVRLGFQGGEPLLHPDVVELTRIAKHELGFEKVSMSTNAFLLTEELVHRLARAGLDSLQFSIDRKTPSEGTRKSLQTVQHKLSWFDSSPIKVQVSGVLSDETVDEARQVVDECLGLGVAAHARLVHDDLINDRRLRSCPGTGPMLDLLDYQARRKKEGERIHSTWAILDYQRASLKNEELDWTCVAGYKYFFVSAQGLFWLCSQVRTGQHILDITEDDLLSYNEKKDCQQGCGVYCTVDMSFAVSHPARYLMREVLGLVGSGLRGLAKPSISERLEPKVTT